jgi:hypothetical protein
MAYDFDSSLVGNLLKNDIGIDYLYHANSVRTACTFLQCGGLLSRGAVEDRGLRQTWQKSDDTDKKFGVWYDIFLDDCDLHNRSNRINYYGPVLFVFNLDILLRPHLPKMRVTKSNPQDWNENQTERKRYFYDLHEIKNYYSYGTFAQILTLRQTKDILVFGDSLEKIILDDPGRELDRQDAFSQALQSLKAAAASGQVNVEINKRECRSVCECNTIYNEMKEKSFTRLFRP